MGDEVEVKETEKRRWRRREETLGLGLGDCEALRSFCALEALKGDARSESVLATSFSWRAMNCASVRPTLHEYAPTLTYSTAR